MQSQKKIKPLGCEGKEYSQKKDKKQKQDKLLVRGHKASEVHTKSVSKDVNMRLMKITPKKQSIIVRKSKYKDACSSSKKIGKNRNKQLTSMCSYSMIEKESMPVTKRKGSNAYSIKKNGMIRKSRDKMSSSIKSAVNNFSILTKCLTEYLKEQKKTGKNPSKQILHLIKAFNRSQIAPLSKDLEKLINKMLDYIEHNVTFPQQHELILGNEPHVPPLKSRSSFSQTSQHQIAYSQILENNFVPSTLKKTTKHENKQSTYDNINDSKNKTNIDIKHDNFEEEQRWSKEERKKQKVSVDKQLERQLKNDIKNMHSELCNLKEAGEKLQQISGCKYEDRKKLQEIYSKNKQKLAEFGKSTTQNLKYVSFKTEQDQQHGQQSSSEGNRSESGKD